MERYVLVRITDERPMPPDTDWAFAVKDVLLDAPWSSPHRFGTADVTDLMAPGEAVTRSGLLGRLS